jgi:hypothetical protein
MRTQPGIDRRIAARAQRDRASSVFDPMPWTGPFLNDCTSFRNDHTWSPSRLFGINANDSADPDRLT